MGKKSSNTYFKLTQNETMDLTDVRLKQFLNNILVHRYRLDHKENFFTSNIKKQTYDYDDFTGLNIDWDDEQFMTKSIARRLSNLSVDNVTLILLRTAFLK